MEPPSAPTASDPRGITTPLDPDRVEALLRELDLLDKWMHVVEGLRSGFDTGVSTDVSQTLIVRNHSSADLVRMYDTVVTGTFVDFTFPQDPNFIDSYIAQEQAAGRYSSGFDPGVLEHIIGPFCTSPLGLVPKPGSSKLRMIQDLSYPRNDPTLTSVNSHVNSDDFPTAWGTFDDLSSLVLTLPHGCKAAAFDISAAYRITPVLPSQQHVLCVFWRGKVYVDRAVCFGLSSSAGVFGAIADMLVSTLR